MSIFREEFGRKDTVFNEFAAMKNRFQALLDTWQAM